MTTQDQISTARKVASHAGTAAGTAAIVAATVAFLPGWEGMDKVAKRDMIGTGHPITYCYGQTDEFGKVKVGARFTKQECDERLAESLPFYLSKIQPCVKVDVPAKSMAALLDAAYNAGSAAVCRSPMVAKINAGDLKAACNAFAGWYVRSDGQVRKGLVARRSGIGDGRKSERDLCLEGLNEGLPPKPITPEEFAIDKYSCFGAGRYEAMSKGQTCPTTPTDPKPVAVKKHWWQK